MKRVALYVVCLWLAVPLFAQNAANAPATSPAEDRIDTPLEYYFGALALLAIVMTWAWVWLRIKDRPKLPPPDFDTADETEDAEPAETDTRETEKDA